MNLSDSRVNYNKSELHESIVQPDPFDQFAIWFEDVKNSSIREANAMVIATAASDGKPSARIVLLKEVNGEGFIFYTNYDSRKGKELEKNPQAQILFFWDDLERQIRIEGSIKRIDTESSDRYFYSRPIESQYGAMISDQSAVIPSREYLEEKRRALKNTPPARPDNWGGYILMPVYFEFWQGRPSRLHDRIAYIADGDKWKIERLSP